MNNTILFEKNNNPRKNDAKINLTLQHIFSKLTREQVGGIVFIRETFFSISISNIMFSLDYDTIKEIKIEHFSDFFEISIWHGQAEYLTIKIKGKYSKDIKEVTL